MTDDEKALRQLLDALPIYATRIGYRTDSTPQERAFGDAMWDISNRWGELKPDLEALS